MKRMRAVQRGAALLEAMVALLIFSFGILGLVGLQAVAIKNSGDAKYRADASFLANQIIAQMWADDPANLAGYAHAGSSCSPADDPKCLWLTEVANVLPNAPAANQQIVVDANTGSATYGQVSVTVRWRANQEDSDHNHVVTAQVRTN